ncbi:MAG: foldase [Armatimonadetes bacterium]|jgi:parvulin-like peptidyl-prolyl isomerase|nr:foldase [Armatimonadota bacterium]
MKSSLLVSFLALGLTVAPVAVRAQDNPLDALVLASVGKEEITRRELADRLIEYRGEEALEKMIGRVVLQQEAKRLAQTVSDEELDRKMMEIQARFRSEEAYHKFLTSSRLKESQLREDTRNSLLLQKVALKENPIQETDLEQFDVRVIVAPDKAKIAEWLGELGKGSDFIFLATQKSTDPELRKARGRLQPFLKIEMLDVWQAISDGKLKPGDYTKAPVQLSNGNWAIIRLERRLPVAVSASPSEQERLNAMVIAYRVDQWMSQARTKAKVVKNGMDKSPVATVNGEPIERNRFVLRLLEYYGEEALEQMANREVLLQAARAQNATIPDAEANKLFADVRAKFKTQEEYETFLTRSYLTEKQLRDEVRFNALMEKVALQESPVTDEDLTQYEIRKMTVANQVKGAEIVKKLEEGEDFGKLASIHSLDPNDRVAGGLKRPFLKIDLLDIWRAIDQQKLKPGTYTKTAVLLTDNSYNLIKLENVKPVAQVTPGEREKLRKRVVEYRVGQWLDQARARTKIAYPVPLAVALK